MKYFDNEFNINTKHNHKININAHIKNLFNEIETNIKRNKIFFDQNDSKESNPLAIYELHGKQNQQEKAIDLYKNGKLFNIVLTAIGTIGNVEISKNRVYTNEAVEKAYEEYVKLIKEQSYYRIMFDSHPSKESDEDSNLGESNSFDSIAGYVLDVKLKNLTFNNKIHKAIIITYVITKQAIIDTFMRSVEPVLSISQRGLMGNINSFGRNYVKTEFNNVTLMSSMQNWLDLQQPESSEITFINELILMGQDIVTYPANFLCRSQKENIVGVNITDMKNIIKDNNSFILKDDLYYKYIKDHIVNINSPIGLYVAQCNANYLKKYKISTDSIENIKTLLGGKDINMKIVFDKLNNKEYLFSVLSDFANVFSDMDEILNINPEEVDEWIETHTIEDVEDDEKYKEICDAFKEFIKIVENYKDDIIEWIDKYMDTVNKEIIDNIIKFTGIDNFKMLVDMDFQFPESKNPEDLILNFDSLSDGERHHIKDLITQNCAIMSKDPMYFKNLFTNNFQSENQKAIEDAALINQRTEVSEKPQDGRSVKEEVYQIRQSNTLSDEDFKTLVDEVFAIVLGYENPREWKLPHHTVKSSDEQVDVQVSRRGLIAAAQALSGARGGVIATPEEKTKAAQHLRNHFVELKMEVPEILDELISKKGKVNDTIFENEKITITLDEDFIKKLSSNEEYFEQKQNITKNDAFSALDAVGYILSPFIQEPAYLEIEEDMFTEIIKHLNTAAVKIGQLINGEYKEVEENTEIYNKFSEQINELKNNLSELTEKYKQMQNENITLQKTIENLKYERETLENRWKESLDKIDFMEKKNDLYEKQMTLLFNYKDHIDEDVFNEIKSIDSVEKFNFVNKWLIKTSKKNKVNIMDIFNHVENDIERNSEQHHIAEDSMQKIRGIFDQHNESIKKDKVINDIIKLIKSK